jgi:hypothetical protein
MITGYNTDVRHGDVVLHVQTEDKGLSNPFVESIIYVSGQVLAARRSSYAALVAEGKGEREIAGLMDHQHRTIIAAIRAGRFDDKIAARLGIRPAARATPTSASLAVPESAGGPTLDQVILDYLSNEAENEQLVLSIDGNPQAVPGARNVLAVRASSSKTGMPVAGAQVMVKILSTVAEPRTLSAGETDDDGALDVVVDIPAFERGTAALIISAISELGRAEIKSLL